jgi:hypothetical protein
MMKTFLDYEKYGAFVCGYLACLRDCEDYDHDPDEMIEIAWQDYLNGEI